MELPSELTAATQQTSKSGLNNSHLKQTCAIEINCDGPKEKQTPDEDLLDPYELQKGIKGLGKSNVKGKNLIFGIPGQNVNDQTLKYLDQKTGQFAIKRDLTMLREQTGPPRAHTVPDARNLGIYHDTKSAVSKMKQAAGQAALLQREKEVFTRAEESDGDDSANEMVVPDHDPGDMQEGCTLAEILMEEGSAPEDMLKYGDGEEFDDSGQDSDGQDLEEDEEKNLQDGQAPGAEFFQGVAERKGTRQKVVPPLRKYELGDASDSDE